MKILFATAHFGFLRNFESAIRQLALRGHEVVLTSERSERMGGQTIIDRLQGELSTLVVKKSPKAKKHRWNAYGRGLRLCLDYLRYLDPRFDDSPKLRLRAAGQVSVWIVRFSSLPLIRSRLVGRMLRGFLRAVERATPVNPEVVSFLRQEAPDVLLVTPLLYFGSNQVDIVRAAHSLGITTVLGVGSWDHLTTKGLIHEVPDWLAVWNPMQRQEAAEFHGVSSDRVIVTGAQAYDHWFDRTPLRIRQVFCEQVGLRADRPFLLYLCSSIFIAPNEHVFIRQWLDRIRRSEDLSLREVGILIRPHPQNAAQLHELDMSGHDNVAIWPAAGANPVDTSSRDDYFDSMYHSTAVVGLNTSAMIEAGIVGRPVYTVLEHEFAGTQEGTLHFQHLVSVNGGLLHSAHDLQEHAEHLAAALAQCADHTDKSRRFVEAFVRPCGLDRPGGVVFAEAIENVARQGAQPRRIAPVWAPALRFLAYPLAVVLDATLASRKSKRPGQSGS